MEHNYIKENMKPSEALAKATAGEEQETQQASDTMSESDEETPESFYSFLLKDSGGEGKPTTPVEEESEERRLDFYIHESTSVVGGFKMRPYYNTEKGNWFVHFMKQNDLNWKRSDAGNTHMAVSAYELRHFINILKKQYREIKKLKLGERLPRLAKSEYGRVDDFNSPKYWDKSIVDFLDSKSLGVRPSLSSDGYSLRFWVPRRNVERYKNWIGRTASMRIGLVPKFIKVLEQYFIYIEKEMEKQTDVELDFEI